MTPKFRPQLVPDVAGQQPRGHTHTGQHTTSAGAYNVKLAKSHVLKMSALVWGFPKNAKQRAVTRNDAKKTKKSVAKTRSLKF